MVTVKGFSDRLLHFTNAVSATASGPPVGVSVCDVEAACVAQKREWIHLLASQWTAGEAVSD